MPNWCGYEQPQHRGIQISPSYTTGSHLRPGDSPAHLSSRDVAVARKPDARGSIVVMELTPISRIIRSLDCARLRSSTSTCFADLRLASIFDAAHNDCTAWARWRIVVQSDPNLALMRAEWDMCSETLPTSLRPTLPLLPRETRVGGTGRTIATEVSGDKPSRCRY